MCATLKVFVVLIDTSEDHDPGTPEVDSVWTTREAADARAAALRADDAFNERDYRATVVERVVDVAPVAGWAPSAVK